MRGSTCHVTWIRTDVIPNEFPTIDDILDVVIVIINDSVFMSSRNVCIIIIVAILRFYVGRISHNDQFNSRTE